MELSHSRCQSKVLRHSPSTYTPSKSTTSPLRTPRLPSNVSITPPTVATLHSYRRLISLLLPIAYPASFYTASISPPPDTFALLALWQDTPTSDPIVVAGIQARVEPAVLPSPFECSSTSSQDGEKQHSDGARTLYVLTLAVLAPYRGLGIATALLSFLLALALSPYPSIQSIYAHVWEANTDALEWYVRRGFAIEGLVASYYRRLKPSGARLVRRAVRVEDWLAAGADTERKAGVLEDALGLTTIEKKGIGKERDDGEEAVDYGSAQPTGGNKDLTRNGKRRYDDEEDVNDGLLRGSHRIG
ncbi:hypothetical protein MMC07_003796 [Pseudocyphellaria aurata]|nr:hypothetical protein [Pseudocyphellaria aurata]